MEALVSASPEDEDGKTREEVVKTEIEDNDNNNLTIPQVVNRLGMVFFLLFFNLGITIFVFLLTGMMLFSQILFIIFAMFLPISFLLSMIPSYESMAKQAIVRVFNTIMTRAGITLIVTAVSYTHLDVYKRQIKHREDDREYMGRTLYLGSLKSDVYFCIYEKDYEQYVKLGTPLEEADIINRFEIRLRNERAYYAVRDLLTYYDAEQTAFSIINQYVRFVDEEPDKRKSDWKLNDRWAWFIGDKRQRCV